MKGSEEETIVSNEILSQNRNYKISALNCAINLCATYDFFNMIPSNEYHTCNN